MSNFVNQYHKQNYCLNFIKGIACFGILYMHTSYDCLFSSLMSCLVRFAVLIFFMISGYYCYNDDRKIVRQKLPGKMKHIAKLSLFSTVLYIVWDAVIYPILFKGGVQSIDLISYFSRTITAKKMILFVFFNQAIYGGVLWFLFALLYCYIILFLVNKYDWYKASYILVPILILIHLLTRGFIQYFQLIDETVNIAYYRNFIFMGFPFFMLGNLIHKYESKLVYRISNKKLIFLIFAGIAMSCFERLLVVLELFTGTVIATTCMFIFAIKNPEKKIIPIIETIGRKYSLIIYITHPIVNICIYQLGCVIGLGENKLFLFMKPVLIYVIIPCVAWIYENIMRMIKNNITAVK